MKLKDLLGEMADRLNFWDCQVFQLLQLLNFQWDEDLWRNFLFELMELHVPEDWTYEVYECHTIQEEENWRQCHFEVVEHNECIDSSSVAC